MALTFNLMDFWMQGDAVSHIVLLLLLLLSVSSWAIIVGKSARIIHLQRVKNNCIENFWNAENIAHGMQALQPIPTFHDLAVRGVQAVNHFKSHHENRQGSHLDSQLSVSELVTRALRQGLNRALSDLERGQTFLASVGSVSPFIGLFGTVWGIYHALAAIGISGQASLDKVAGPVGEALVMTALGLFVAIPAVLAYNAFNRAQRLIIADVDGFAHDLHTYFTIDATNISVAEKNNMRTSNRTTPPKEVA